MIFFFFYISYNVQLTHRSEKPISISHRYCMQPTQMSISVAFFPSQLNSVHRHLSHAKTTTFTTSHNFLAHSKNYFSITYSFFFLHSNRTQQRTTSTSKLLLQHILYFIFFFDIFKPTSIYNNMNSK